MFGASAFLDLEGAYRLRFAGPPDEFRADITLGVNCAPKLMLLAQNFNTISNGGGAPGFLAWESHKGQASLVYALDERWSIEAGAFATLFRRNTNSEYGALIALWRRF